MKRDFLDLSANFGELEIAGYGIGIGKRWAKRRQVGRGSHTKDSRGVSGFGRGGGWVATARAERNCLPGSIRQKMPSSLFMIEVIDVGSLIQRRSSGLRLSGLRASGRDRESDRGRTWLFRNPIAKFGLAGVRLRVERVLLSRHRAVRKMSRPGAEGTGAGAPAEFQRERNRLLRVGNWRPTLRRAARAAACWREAT